MPRAKLVDEVDVCRPPRVGVEVADLASHQLLVLAVTAVEQTHFPASHEPEIFSDNAGSHFLHRRDVDCKIEGSVQTPVFTSRAVREISMSEGRFG